MQCFCRGKSGCGLLLGDKVSSVSSFHPWPGSRGENRIKDESATVYIKIRTWLFEAMYQKHTHFPFFLRQPSTTLTKSLICAEGSPTQSGLFDSINLKKTQRKCFTLNWITSGFRECITLQEIINPLHAEDLSFNTWRHKTNLSTSTQLLFTERKTYGELWSAEGNPWGWGK